MEQIGNDLMRLPTKERALKVAYGVVGAGVLVMLVNAFGSSVLAAVNTLFDITAASAKLAVAATLLGLGATTVWMFMPFIKAAIRTSAYRTLSNFIEMYPIEQMHFEHHEQLRDIDRDRHALKMMEGQVQHARDEADVIQEEIDKHRAAAVDRGVSQATREMSQLTLAGKVEEIKPYQEIIKFGEPLIAVAHQMIAIQERVAAAYAQSIKVETARFRCAESLEVIAGNWAKRFSAAGTQARRNAEMARESVHRKFANAKGAINNLRPQMDAMIKAYQMKDEIAAASARRYIEQAARTIEIPMVEIVDSNNVISSRRQPELIKLGGKSGN